MIISKNNGAHYSLFYENKIYYSQTNTTDRRNTFVQTNKKKKNFIELNKQNECRTLKKKKKNSHKSQFIE